MQLLKVVAILSLVVTVGCETRFQAQQRQREKVAKDLKKFGEQLHNAPAKTEQPSDKADPDKKELPVTPDDKP